MKSSRNCNSNYPVYPQPMIMPPYGMPAMPNYNGVNSNIVEQQLNNLEQQINLLDQRVSRLESMNTNNTNYNKYNDSNYYMV